MSLQIFASTLPALRSDDGGGRPVIGDRRHVDVEIRPFGLMPFLEPRHDARGAARRRRHEEVIVGDARGHAVVHHHAVLIEHQAVAAFAGRELGPGVGVDTIEEFANVLAAKIDLAERGGVHDADAAPRGEAFTAHGRVNVLARLSGNTRDATIARRARTQRRAQRGLHASANSVAARRYRPRERLRACRR